MKKEKSDLITESTYSEITATLEALAFAGVSSQDFDRIREDKNLAKRIAVMIHKIENWGKYFPITVDYSRTLMQMLEAGKYEWLPENFNFEQFNIKIPDDKKGKEELRAYLVSTEAELDGKTALVWLDENGLRPATIPELLAFGEKYPEEQRKFQIIALGLNDDLDGHLWEPERSRGFRIHWYMGYSSFGMRLLAVPK